MLRWTLSAAIAFYASLLFAPRAQAQACSSFSISPINQNFTFTGGTGLVTINASPPGCTSPRTASSNASWISLSFGQSGNGAGSVAYSVQQNSSASARTATITIAGQVFTVNQEALECTFSITPLSQTFAPEGGTGAITVGASPSGCQSNRTAATTATWITISSGASGAGAGTVTYSVQANSTSALRSGTITVAGRTFTVTQNPQNCNYSISPLSAAFQASGGNAQITINVSPAGCSSTRTAISNASWITISFGAAGTGAGTVGYTVAANNFLAERTGTITVAGQTFTVIQAAGSCALTLQPTSASVPSTGGAGNFAVTANNTDCGWTPVSSAEWLTVTSGPGRGNGRVDFSAAPNAFPSSRTASIALGGGVTFNVTQTAVCLITLNPVSAIYTGSGGTGSFQVQTQGSGCSWSAVSNADFITLTGTTSGTSNGTVNYAVAAQITAGDRNGVITVGNQGFTVFQSGSCSYALSPSSASFAPGGGGGQFTVTTTCPWTAASSDAWLTVSPTSGTGNATLNFTVEGNSSPGVRNGRITVGGQPFDVRQDGITCTVTISPAQIDFTDAGGALSITTEAGEGCNWSASTTAGWISIGGGSGLGPGSFVVNAAPNRVAQRRTATVTVANQRLTVNQAAANCEYSVNPGRAAFEVAGGNGTFTVSTACAWTAASQVPWITIGSGSSSGTGDGVVNYAVSRLTGGDSRTGTIRVNTATFTVTQTAGACVLSVQPGTLTVPGSAGRGTIQVSGTSACRWEPVREGDWLTISSWSNVGGSGTVSFSYPANPFAQQRQATIRVTSPGTEPQVVAVSQAGLTPRINAGGVVNAATLAPGPISPGQIVTIFGQSLGPVELAGAQLTPDGTGLEKTVANVQVLVDGLPSPIVYVSNGQVAAVVPYAVAGKESVRVVVRNQGVDSTEEPVNVAAAAPGIFTANASGRGQAAALNQDGSVNRAATPVARNQIVVLYLTGEGLTRPASTDGQITGGGTLPVPTLPVTVQIGGQNAQVVYAGAAPGLVAGVMQVNARVAQNAAVGGTVPVVVRVGTFTSQAGVTIAVR